MSDHSTSTRTPRRLGPALLRPLALLFVAAAFQATARADSVQLTGGQVFYDGLVREVRVVISGQNFSVRNFLSAYPPQGPNTFTIGTFGCGCDGLGGITYNGLTVSAFAGGGTFTDTTISGRIILFGFFDETFGQPPFPITIDFFGTGVLQRTATGFIFNVTSPVPEPATLVLLGTGLAGVAARVRKRRKARRADGDSAPV